MRRNGHAHGLHWVQSRQAIRVKLGAGRHKASGRQTRGGVDRRFSDRRRAARAVEAAGDGAVRPPDADDGDRAKDEDNDEGNDGEEYDPAAVGGTGVSSSEDETAPLLVETPLPGTSLPTQNKTVTTHTLDVEMDSTARAATRMPAPSELGNGEGKVARIVEVPQPPPNKHSVDGDGSVVAPAHKTPQPPPNKHTVDGDGDNAPAHNKKQRKNKKLGGRSKRRN